MHENAFANKPRKPTDSELAEALGPAKALWNDLIDVAAKELTVADQEWKCYSPKYGWSLRLKQKKRNILYLSPSRGAFLASLVLGDKAMESARKSGFPKTLMKILDEAKRYPEGTAIRIDVKKEKHVDFIKKLMVIKLEN